MEDPVDADLSPRTPPVAAEEAASLLKWCRKSISSPKRQKWLTPEVADLVDEIEGYELLDLLGRGAMGAVYRAQAADGTLVAIKILPEELAEDDDFVYRFAREAEALAKLRHKNIVSLLGNGVSISGLPYYAMELVDGHTLQQTLTEYLKAPETSIEIICKLADALAHCHDNGIVHRDVKPSNIIIDAKGEPKLADFGLARPTEVASSLTLTYTGIGLGTPEYAAPEQMKGQGLDNPRVDIYSLASVACEMLTGLVPRSFLALQQRATSFGPDVDAVLLKALQPDPTKRHEQMAAFGQELRSAYNRRNSRWKSLIAASVLGLGVVGASIGSLWKPPAGERPSVLKTPLDVSAVIASHSPYVPGRIQPLSSLPLELNEIKAKAPQIVGAYAEQLFLGDAISVESGLGTLEERLKKAGEPLSGWVIHLLDARKAFHLHDWNFSFRNAGGSAHGPRDGKLSGTGAILVEMASRIVHSRAALYLAEPEYALSELRAGQVALTELESWKDLEEFAAFLEAEMHVGRCECFLALGNTAAATEEWQELANSQLLQAQQMTWSVLQAKAWQQSLATRLLVSEAKFPEAQDQALRAMEVWLAFIDSADPVKRGDEALFRLRSAADACCELLR